MVRGRVNRQSTAAAPKERREVALGPHSSLSPAGRASDVGRPTSVRPSEVTPLSVRCPGPSRQGLPMMLRASASLPPGLHQLLPSSLLNQRRDTYDSQSP